MLTRTCLLVICMALPSVAQEADFGLSMPVTMSAGAMHSGRLQLSGPANSPNTAGFRLMLYPTLKLGSHWFAYAAVQSLLSPYFYYDAFFPKKELETELIQGFVGYATRVRSASLVFKAGQLASAFGSFPLRYDDVDNPLIDQPLNYITELPLRADQLLCGVPDLRHQSYGSVAAGCGGAPGRAGGLTPVTLYGTPGAQAEISVRKFDARLQAVASSPANPLGWSARARYLQFVAGGGYTIRQGFRLGASTFSGPYLSPGLANLLPSGTTVRDFPATGRGLDVQWARGRWSVNGEWQRIRFAMPGFVVPPSVGSGYAEAKAVLVPRVFVAGRAGWLKPGRVLDASGLSLDQFASTLKSYEVASGIWLNRRALLKVSYSFLRSPGRTGTAMDVFGFQFITHFNTPQLVIH